MDTPTIPASETTIKTTTTTAAIVPEASEDDEPLLLLGSSGSGTGVADEPGVTDSGGIDGWGIAAGQTLV